MIRRREDWPERLAALVESRRYAPFAWGANDCALFAADAVLAMTNQDLAAELRGQYTTAASARRVASASLPASLDLAAIATAALGESIPTAQARRGDVLLAEHAAGRSLAVCLGAIAVAPGADGLLFLAPASWRQAWKVG